ncbi:MAG: ribonuclease D [Magnetococcus sp. DMHC-6]
MNTHPMPTKILTGDLDEERHALYMASHSLAVDTETLGLNTLRDRLCVVQMCNEDGVVTLLRPLGTSAPRLQELFESSSVEKIFHFARFDLAALKYWLNIDVAPIFCTKIASRLVRTYTNQHGLKDLIRELVGIELNKEQQSSDWAADSLSPKQIEYAASDVIHLIAAKEKLVTMLVREKRLELARSCMNFLTTRATLDLAGWDQEDIFSHSS